MAALDLTTAVDRVRLAIADYADPEILDDATIQYVLTKHDDNETAATKECAMYILGMLAQSTHSRIDRIEMWGSERFNNYLVYLKQVLMNPSMFLTGGIYAGGVDVTDFNTDASDVDNIQRQIPSYSNYRSVDYTEYATYTDVSDLK